MRKGFAFLGAALCLAVSPRAFGQASQFNDLDPSHWAYQAVENLRQKGYLIGYPDGPTFKGRRTMTRYEFAVAIDRILQNLPGGIKGDKGDKGDPGERGPQGEQGPPGPAGSGGVTPEDLAALRKLMDTFRDELAALGTNMTDARKRIDDLEKSVRDINARLDRMPMWDGGVFFGFRTDRSNSAFFDADGNARNPSGLVTSPSMYHEMDIGVSANLGGSAIAHGHLNVGNYVSGLNGNYGFTNTDFGTRHSIAPLPESLYIRDLRLDTPMEGLRNTTLTLGRFSHRLTPLTFMRVDTDRYFDLPWQDDYYMDGIRANTRLGSVGVQLFGGSFKNINDQAGNALFAPLGGAQTVVKRGFNVLPGSKIVIGRPAQIADQGQIALQQMAGLRLTLPITHVLDNGGLGLTIYDASGQQGAANRPFGFVGGPGAFSNLLVFGADANFKLGDKLALSGEWAKTITGDGIRNSVGVHDNNAFWAQGRWGTGGLDITAGYKYIDPRFYTPGYWGRIGSWYNPTNIQGPYGTLSYAFSPQLNVNLTAAYYTGARNRQGGQPNGLGGAITGGFGINDKLVHLVGNANWVLAKNISTMVEYEGVLWDVETKTGGLQAGHPVENYVTLGVGYNVSANALLKIGYQIIGYSDAGGVFTGTPGLTYSGQTMTIQSVVKF